MVTETKFQGWLGLDERSVEGKMEWREFPHPKPWTESDVDIEVTRCGICKISPPKPVPRTLPTNPTRRRLRHPHPPRRLRPNHLPGLRRP